MPRHVVLQPHLTTEDLKQAYKSSHDPVESRRFHLLWLVASQKSIKDAAAVVGYHYDYAKDVVGRYNREGPSSLQNGRKRVQRRGRKPLLTPEQFGQLEQTLGQPPVGGGVWTGSKVAQWIQETTGREKIWEQRGWDYLKRYRLENP